ncbi:hypothetical protein [Microbacterium sp. MYb62]|uniref:hypothetical protein n=1 Tax=Microbacterium sp. MYb62 TaxID=1848690 RepID=UPI000CFE306A|nr:hypothetical protein [Microbacterium sp. MYb62]PRB14459.1 hypothetical protein CQ042_11100 [Microbacterium sp. MYb62]
MTAIDDLNDIKAELSGLRQRVRELETGTPQQSMSITEGRMRFIGGLLRIDSGGRVEIVGFLQIQGQADIIGPVTISGDTHSTGEWTQVGPWHLNGDGSIAGDVDITGDLNLLSDLIVSSLGRIKVGGMTFDPSIAGGAVTFPNGAQVFTNGSTIQVYLGNGVVQVSDSEVKMQLGGTSLRLTSGHIYGAGMATKSVASVPGGFLNAIVYDSGEWKRLI